MSDLTQDGYVEALALAKKAIQSARTRAVLAVNSELLGLYWNLGRLILDRQAVEGPRSQVARRLSRDLRAAFPEMKGLSEGNLDYMRRFAAAWPGLSSLQLVGKMPWGHNQLLLDRLDTRDLREWYAGQAIEFGWSRAVLENQIMSGLHDRVGRAPSNFERSLPADESELIQQITKRSLQFVVSHAGTRRRRADTRDGPDSPLAAIPA
jgi:predicted nuclease of restriction endonuclease-like (RecB) superfamily